MKTLQQLKNDTNRTNEQKHNDTFGSAEWREYWGMDDAPDLPEYDTPDTDDPTPTDPTPEAPAPTDESPTESEKKPTRAETIKKIIEYFEENEDIFNDCIEDLDSYNGYLNDNRYYSMDDIDEFYRGTDPLEILRRAYFGHDENYHTDSHGNREYSEFNPNREYFTFNGYGNLISADYKDYSAHLDEYAVEEMSKNRVYIDSIESDDELAELFDELEEAEDGE